MACLLRVLVMFRVVAMSVSVFSYMAYSLRMLSVYTFP